MTIRGWKLAVFAVCAFAALPWAWPQHTLAPTQGAHIALLHQRIANFLAQRGASSGRQRNMMRTQDAALVRKQQAEDTPASLTAPWTSIGPQQVLTPAYGLVTGRVTSIAVDPSDATGNTVYIGTTGGGVWKSTNAAGPFASVTFSPLTDSLPAYSNASMASLSIGALSVQPASTNGSPVVLAGTGDPNDALDSYYGSGILRSEDGGNTWTLIDGSQDGFHGGYQNYSFDGVGFAGFAWSTVNNGTVTTNTVVAAVTDSIEGDIVNAPDANNTLPGLYYSSDAGATWLVATIEDGPYQVVQAGNMRIAGGGNPATSVVWNPVRQRFYAAIRYHGYYESPDGITWTRLQSQPGADFTAQLCPANPGQAASTSCPIFRGTVAAQPVTGDLFALTVDFNNQDQGLWRDACNLTPQQQCASNTVNFSQQIDSTPIDVSNSDTTIAQGDYDLTLAAVPSGQDTLLFVGTEDVYRSSMANSFAWRNTTNSNGCAAAKVAGSNHAIDATFGQNGLMYFGNDGGLWRSIDDVDQQQQSCQPDDATHYQNLNSGLGSLAEVNSFSVDPTNSSAILAGLGALGTAAPQSGQTAWTQVLTGEGSRTAIDPDTSQNWYASSGPGVSINLCADGAACTPAGFGSQPVIGDTQTAMDGDYLLLPSAWILDPQDPTKMIVGTCRVWRGEANGTGWSASNLLSPVFDDAPESACNGDAQVRSLAASGSPGDGPNASEMIYAGMAGTLDNEGAGGATIPGHVYAASVIRQQDTIANWTDQYNSPVTNDTNQQFNPGGFDISSIYVDPHDPSGQTVYVTVEGFDTNGVHAPVVYRSTDAGAHWANIMSNLPDAPANSIVVDPNDANTVYIALDTGVYVTRDITSCSDQTQSCWVPFGTELPKSPVTQLTTVNDGGTPTLDAATYGRGIWQIPLLGAVSTDTMATLTPQSLTFTVPQPRETPSPSQQVTVTNTGALPLTISQLAASGDFTEQDNCTLQPVAPGNACTAQVTFTPTALGARQGTLTVYGNVAGGQVTAALNGTGIPGPAIVFLPATLNFGSILNGTTSPAQYVTISNTGATSISLQSELASGDFQITANTCSASLPTNTGCTLGIIFTPSASGARAGTLTVKDGAGTQTATLSGIGLAPPTDTLSATGLVFAPLTIGSVSAPQQVTITNSGGERLGIYSVTFAGSFAAANGCPNPLPGGTSCAITVRYVPGTIGAENGTLTIADALHTQNVKLSGTGLAPIGMASATPVQVNFDSVGVGGKATQAVTLTNNGHVALTGLTYTVTGAFTLNNNCGANLNTGGNCQIGVDFVPAQTGPQSGVLTVSSPNLPAPLRVALNGTGESFQLGLIGQANGVIVSGQTAHFQVQVNPTAGSSGTVQFTCAGAPPNAACTVNPTQLQINGGTTGTLNVSVATGVATAANRRASPFGNSEKYGLALASMLPFLFLRRKQRRVWMIAFAAVALMLLPTACGVAASSGSSAPPPGNQAGSTAPGTYTITVTGTVPGLQVSVPYTLIVQ